MVALINFGVAFFFTFIGTIPPGTLNLSIRQLGNDNKIRVAWRFALAASMIEYPYAWLAVKFEKLITSSPVFEENAQLITAVVMTLLGAVSLYTPKKTSRLSEKLSNSGFMRGLVLGILNPLALPFWVGTTAYLNSQHWIDLSTSLGLQAYLIGICLGTLSLFILLVYLAQKIASVFQESKILKKIPGVILLALGIYAFVNYFL
jgi:threonine/homoserine/homoserine lactone efflux protein